MTAPAHIASFLVEGVLGLTARDRFGAMQRHGNTGVMTSGWFTVLMVIVLVTSVAVFIAVSFYKGAKGLKFRKKKGEAEGQAPVIRNSASENRGSVTVTRETAPVTRGAAPVNQSEPAAKTAIEAEIALFPFSKKFDTTGGDEEQFLDFWQATITGLAGKVISLETTLTASVGDRVLVVISPAENSEGQIQELIEDIGVVRQVQKPDSTNEPDAKRLAVELTGLSEAQVAGLNDFIKRVSAKAEITANAGAK
jgi:hypothetical protein